jgi:hypothetical protein
VYLLAVLGPGGIVIGCVVGMIPAASSTKQMFEHMALGSAIGGAAGLAIAFAMSAGFALAALLA